MLPVIAGYPRFPPVGPICASIISSKFTHVFNTQNFKEFPQNLFSRAHLHNLIKFYIFTSCCYTLMSLEN